eukprot:TRINITY_DN2441_c0_g1_i13.p3 TRINITY_DN2441_c0_g1~~TRINITY_DN2441_c0_g1_i13.p3  ORF type:complete len:573 (+),score=123.79 TRINITY_DN2441_c0_g1_i13:240-1721(+)
MGICGYVLKDPTVAGEKPAIKKEMPKKSEKKEEKDRPKGDINTQPAQIQKLPNPSPPKPKEAPQPVNKSEESSYMDLLKRLEKERHQEPSKPAHYSPSGKVTDPPPIEPKPDNKIMSEINNLFNEFESEDRKILGEFHKRSPSDPEPEDPGEKRQEEDLLKQYYKIYNEQYSVLPEDYPPEEKISEYQAKSKSHLDVLEAIMEEEKRAKEKDPNKNLIDIALRLLKGAENGEDIEEHLRKNAKFNPLSYESQKVHSESSAEMKGYLKYKDASKSVVFSQMHKIVSQHQEGQSEKSGTFQKAEALTESSMRLNNSIPPFPSQSSSYLEKGLYEKDFDLPSKPDNYVNEMKNYKREDIVQKPGYVSEYERNLIMDSEPFIDADLEALQSVRYSGSSNTMDYEHQLFSSTGKGSNIPRPRKTAEFPVIPSSEESSRVNITNSEKRESREDRSKVKTKSPSSVIEGETDYGKGRTTLVMESVQVIHPLCSQYDDEAY